MNNASVLFIAVCGIVLLGSLIVFLYLLQDWSLFEESGRQQCNIIGNPRWNHYCRKKIGLRKSNRCNSG